MTQSAKNPFTHLAAQLARRSGPAMPCDASATRTESIRQVLRQSGPCTAKQLADCVQLSNAARVAALLKNDLATGRVQRLDDRYAINTDWDEREHRRVAAAASLLRRHGFVVTRKA